jgi:membrane-bound ClpP family serine protease
MHEEHSLPPSSAGDLHQRAVAAASALRQQATGATTPDLRHLALVRRLTISAALGALGLIVGAVLLMDFVAAGALPWVVGVVLVIAVAGVIVAGVHAGGHGLFIPLPVLVLTTVWAITVSSGNGGTALAWVVAALAFGIALFAAVLLVPAIASAKAAGAPLGGAALLGATGTAVTALSPVGIARVNAETWTAESLSGPLPAGAPVHVAKVEGLRLLVWSEAGNVPGPEVLGSTQQPKEDA